MQAGHLRTPQTHLNSFFKKCFHSPNRSFPLLPWNAFVALSPLPLESKPGSWPWLWVREQAQNPALFHAYQASSFSWAPSSPSLQFLIFLNLFLSSRAYTCGSLCQKNFSFFAFSPVLAWLHSLKGVRHLILLEHPELSCSAVLQNPVFTGLCFRSLSPLPEGRDPICLFHAAYPASDSILGMQQVLQ